jgi:predicted TIM-barrel fold metal-dependent hydrolase
MTLDMKSLQIVDADTHLIEAADIFTSRAPSALKDRVPRVEQIDGKDNWVMDGHVLGPAYIGGVIRVDGVKVEADEAYSQWGLADIHTGSYDLDSRLAVMDEAGIAAQIAFPNNLGLGGQGVAKATSDRSLLDACVELYNDYGMDVQERSGNRVLPMAVMPAWDVEACVRETRRAHEIGLRGVNITSDPSDQGAPDLADPVWDRWWDTCAELQMPVHFHIGNSDTTMSFYDTYSWGSQEKRVKWALGGLMLFLGNARSVANLIAAGVPERHPEVQIVSVESGVGWIPFMLEALRYELSENCPNDQTRLSLTPLEYFQRQFYATTWFEQSDIAYMVQRLGEDRIMFETDFPHPTCLYPSPLESAEENMQGLSDVAKEKILSSNAKRLYRIE